MVLKWLLIFLGVLIPIASLADDSEIEGLIVLPIDRIDVPARSTGLLKTLNVREGSHVRQGSVLANLDDEQVRLEADRAAMELRIAESVAAETSGLELAQKAAQRSEQVAASQAITRDMAHRKALNDIRIRAAEKSEAVAGNELVRASEARKAFIDSVSKSEIDGLTLALQRSQLETKQAVFDREMDALLAQAEDAASQEQKLAVEQSKLGIEKAMAEQSIASLRSRSATLDAQLAILAVQHHALIAPIDGVVVKIAKRPGQWVQVGEPVVEILRLNRLRAEGFVSLDLAQRLAALPLVSIRPRGVDAEAREGKVVFVNPEVDPVNNQVRFWIEFDNPKLDVMPGMQVSITVKP